MNIHTYTRRIGTTSLIISRSAERCTHKYRIASTHGHPVCRYVTFVIAATLDLLDRANVIWVLIGSSFLVVFEKLSLVVAGKWEGGSRIHDPADTNTHTYTHYRANQHPPHYHHHVSHFYRTSTLRRRRGDLVVRFGLYPPTIVLWWYPSIITIHHDRTHVR
jgi:hypothetical protein